MRRLRKEKEKVSVAERPLGPAAGGACLNLITRLPAPHTKLADALMLTSTNSQLEFLLIVYGLNSQNFLKKQHTDLRPHSIALFALFLTAPLLYFFFTKPAFVWICHSPNSISIQSLLFVCLIWENQIRKLSEIQNK